MKPNRSGLQRIYYTLIYSFQGLRAAWRHEAAFRQEVFIFAFVLLVVVLLPVSFLEKGLLIFATGLVLVVELLNSAIESVVDRIGSQRHELSGRAKDLGSAAVFCSIILAGLVWVCVLVDNFLLQ